MYRPELIDKVIDECLQEMYSKAQPPLDWGKLLEECKNGNINDYKGFYEQHYLPNEEYQDIVEKYIRLYRIHNEWKEDADLMIDYLKNGGKKDKYIPEKIDEDGFKHPGYRGHEAVSPLDVQLNNIFKKFNIDNNELKTEILNKVFELMGNCKDFYNPTTEENRFRFSVMNYSPNSNKKDVEKYWKFKIYDRVYDPESEEYVTLTPELLETWKKDLEYWKNEDEYIYNEYYKIINKYENKYENN